MANENNFKYHAPTGNKADKHTVIRDICFAATVQFETVCPPSRELSLALTKLEEAMMWANAAIARNEEVQ